MYTIEKEVSGTKKKSTLILCRGEVGPEFINSVFVGPGGREPVTYKTFIGADVMADKYGGEVVKIKGVKTANKELIKQICQDVHNFSNLHGPTPPDNEVEFFINNLCELYDVKKKAGK